MKQQRHQARIVALQALYELDIQRVTGEVDMRATISPLAIEAELPGEAADFAVEAAAGAWGAREQYDEMISGASDHWEVSRMAVVDRNILRLALHELLGDSDVPPRVAMDEAIEIGREFGEAETPHFINGVLDAIWRKHRGRTDPAGPPGGSATPEASDRGT